MNRAFTVSLRVLALAAALAAGCTFSDASFEEAADPDVTIDGVHMVGFDRDGAEQRASTSTPAPPPAQAAPPPPRAAQPDCVSCGPLPDPWMNGPLPDPWTSSSSGGTGGSTGGPSGGGGNSSSGSTSGGTK